MLLYELLTGTKPHEGESPIQVAYKHVHEDVPPPSTIAPGLPAYIDALVSRATARDLDQRPADAGVLLHQVHRVAQALRDGVREDEELTRDLALSRPVAARQETRQRHRAGAVRRRRVRADDGARSGRTARGSRGPARAPPPSSADQSHRRPQVARITTVRRPRRSKKGPLLLLIALLLVAGGGTGAWWFGWARYTSAPAVLGMMQNPAEKKLEAAGLDVEFGDPAYSETVPKGRVLAADPSAGDRVLDGGTVTLVVSLGKERYDVPRTDGISEDEAQDALLEANLAFGKAIGRWSETVEAGTVLRSDPPAGQTLRPGTVVDLYVSKGRKPLTVTDWTGENFVEARTALQRKGFEVSSTEEYSDTVAQGDVISQSPDKGTLFRGDQVGFVVSLGPELVEVPGGLVASGWESARDALEAAGFEVEIERVDRYLGLGYVYEVDPGSGTAIPKGSTVTLWLI